LQRTTQRASLTAGLLGRLRSIGITVTTNTIVLVVIVVGENLTTITTNFDAAIVVG
jgi:flagellar assembly factor FliW